MRGPLPALSLGLVALTACKASAPAGSGTVPAASAVYPARPTTAPVAFKLLHQDYNTEILVVPESASNDQVAALLWQLRDAARQHAFDQLHLSQKWADARAPKVFFHIYRGAKCATETYGKGPYPCGASYHGAGDFSFGGFSDRNATDGSLVDGSGSPQPLWNPQGN